VKGVPALGKQPKTCWRASLGRRDFLVRSCQWASAAFVPAGLRALGFVPTLAPRPARAIPQVAQDDRITPHYRLKPPLEELLRKVEPGLDAFLTEKYAAQIESILLQWSSGLTQGAVGIEAIQNSLAQSFAASSLRPSERERLRSSAGLDVYRNRF